MTASNHTEHYGLSQYVEDDHPTYAGDCNGDMSKIDAAIYAASQSGGTGGLADVSALTSRIAELESQVSALAAAVTPNATGFTAV